MNLPSSLITCSLHFAYSRVKKEVLIRERGLGLIGEGEGRVGGLNRGFTVLVLSS